ncbi:MAG TPA: protease pro-enzyme activation domain-containing protein [Terriglobales bacterium]
MSNYHANLCQVIVTCALLSTLATAADQGPAPRIVPPVDESHLTVLKGNTHPLARAQFDQGVAPPDLPMQRMLLVLQRSPQQQSALTQLLEDQQNPASSSYHRWLTPDQFGRQFGPADQDIQTVTAWLRGHGFEIGSVTKGRTMIEFSGTAAQVQEAFHTAIHKYVVNGKEHWANASDPQIPVALTPVVAGVHTLHNFLKQPMVQLTGQKITAKLTGGKSPQITLGNGVHALVPSDFATIYNLNPLYNKSAPIAGPFVSVGVVGRSDLYRGGEDLYYFDEYFVGASHAVGPSNIVLNGPNPGNLGGGEEVEATLDLSWAHSVASDTTTQFVLSASTNTTDGVDLSELYIVDNNLTDVMTESFGRCEAGTTSAEEQGIAMLAEQAAAQGISYVVAAGDTWRGGLR